MPVKYGKFELPTSIKLEPDSSTETFGRFVAEPFERGFGHTTGNSLRRILLSSIEAPAIIGVHIEDVPHEYTAIDGVVEDMTNVILNLKGALLSKVTEDDKVLERENKVISSVIDVTQEKISKSNGTYIVTLGELVQDSTFEVINPDLKVFSATKPRQFRVDLRVSFGRGYVSSERHNVRDRMRDEILVDTSFSPVRIVNYFIEHTRVGQDTDYDRLILEITTDSRISPKDALSYAYQIAMNHYAAFEQIETQKLVFETPEEEVTGDDADNMMDLLCQRIDEIELSVRSTNCISGANIEFIAELVIIPERRMLEFRNFGKKSLTEIKAKLSEMGMHLGMDLSKYGLTQENVREKVAEYLSEKSKEKDD